MIKPIEYVYTKNGEFVLVNKENLFVYESSVYLHHKNYFSLCNQTYFISSTFIEGIVSSFRRTKHIQICSELFSAPEQWLIDNEYTRYIKPEKIKRVRNVKVEGNDK
jgi:hypothetical protein